MFCVILDGIWRIADIAKFWKRLTWGEIHWNFSVAPPHLIILPRGDLAFSKGGSDWKYSDTMSTFLDSLNWFSNFYQKSLDNNFANGQANIYDRIRFYAKLYVSYVLPQNKQNYGQNVLFLSAPSKLVHFGLKNAFRNILVLFGREWMS